MSASLTVQYSRSKQTAQPVYAYALKAEVTSATDMPSEIFIYQRGAAPAPSEGEERTDTFLCIADPIDFDEIPVNVPDLENEIPYYRTDNVTLLFRTVSELEDTLELIKADIANLVSTYISLEDFESTESETYN